MTEQVNITKEHINKTLLDKFNERAVQSKISFENLNNSLNENIAQINQRQDKQNKELNFLKTVLFIICVLIVIGTIARILVIK